MNLSIVPPREKTASEREREESCQQLREGFRPPSSRTSVVNPTRSAKRIVTLFVRDRFTSPVAADVRDDLLDDVRRVVALEPPADPLLLGDALVEARALDGDRREVRERGQQVEVLAP